MHKNKNSLEKKIQGQFFKNWFRVFYLIFLPFPNGFIERILTSTIDSSKTGPLNSLRTSNLFYD